MRSIDRVARRLQGEISFDRSADVEGAAVEQRPAPVGTLSGADISSDASFKLRLDAVEIVLQQNKFRRNRYIGLQLEDPVTVGTLQSQ